MADGIEFREDTAGSPVEELSYEQARAELMQVVSRMESGTSNLEETVALWERGEKLVARCEAWLDGARARLAAAQQQKTDEQEDRG